MACSSSDVFAIATRDATEPGFDSGFVVDMAMIRSTGADNMWITSRLTQGKYLITNSTNAEASSTSLMFDYMDGWNANAGTASTLYSWMFKRAKGFFDVVAYTGTGVTGRTVNHNLGVVPEMMWVKGRNAASEWHVYYGDELKALILQSTETPRTGSHLWNDTAPTNNLFTSGSNINTSSNTYIAYLFATLPNISKVGSYTGNGTTQTIDCGFTTGAKFVIVKPTDGGHWSMWDSTRGIVAGNDSALHLNATTAENTLYDDIDPDNSGFIVNYVGGTSNACNGNSTSYIFYAIANPI